MKIEAPINIISKIRDGWSRSSPEQRVYYTNLGILIAAQAADLFFTNIGINMAGVGTAEGWPVTKFIYQETGPVGMSLLKLAGLGLILRYSELIRLKKNEIVASKCIRPVNFAYTTIAAINALSVYAYNPPN